MKFSKISRLIFTLLIISLLVLACKQNQEELTDIDKEIESLQKDLKESEKIFETETSNENTKPSVTETTNIAVETENTQELSRLEVTETEKVKLKVASSDDDLDKVTYTFSAPLDVNGEWQTDYGDAGEYKILVTASDGNLETKKEIILVVTKKNEAPSIESMADLTIDEGQSVEISPKVTDVNNDKITITISEPIGDDGIWETKQDSAGDYKIIITATDGDLSSKEEFSLTVNNKNIAPELERIQDLTINEGETIELHVVVSDLDGDRVTVSISEPIGNDAVWQTSYSDNGEYRITVSANDGKETVSQEFTLTVRDVNRPPQIIDVGLQ